MERPQIHSANAYWWW